MVAVLAVIQPFEQNLVLLYVLSALLVTIIEYATSWLMEVLLHARWWDYSNIPFNLNGRVALPISAFWGVGVVFIVKVIHPLITRVVTHVDSRFGIFAVIILLSSMMFDFGFTLANALAFGAAIERIGDLIATKKAELRKSSQDWLDTYRDKLPDTSKMPRLNYVQRRLLHSLPNLKLPGTNTNSKDIESLVDVVRKLGRKASKQD